MTPARRLTPAGIKRAKAHLAGLRADPLMPADPPDEILFDARFSSSFDDAPVVEHRPLTTRREAAEYAAALVQDVRGQVFDDMPFWSWLSLFHLADILNVRDRREHISREDETFIVAAQAWAGKRDAYRNYLWTAWRILDRYDETAAYLLDRDLTEIGAITRLTTNSLRVFNSVGVVHLILKLYTRGSSMKRGARDSRGGIVHLLRVMEQLELTHDVYGMSAEALMEILPAEFERWKS